MRVQVPLLLLKQQSMTVVTAFPVPLFIKDLEPEQDVTADMENYIQRFYKKTLGECNERPTTLLGDARDDYLVHLQPEFDWLNEQIGEAAKEYLYEMGVNLQKVNIYAQKSWPVVCENTGSIPSHAHKNAIISCVFYLNEPNNDSGALRFESQNCMSYLPLVHKDTDFHYDKVRLLPLKHRLVMFPASMMHSVEDYIGETPRFSISYDLIVVGSEPPGNGDFEHYIMDPCYWEKL